MDFLRRARCGFRGDYGPDRQALAISMALCGLLNVVGGALALLAGYGVL